MIGRVGDDHLGTTILQNFKDNDVNVDYVEPVTDMESGTAHIILAEGDNSIIVVKAANDHVTPAYVAQAIDVIKASDIVMIQRKHSELLEDFNPLFTGHLNEHWTLFFMKDTSFKKKVPDSIYEISNTVPVLHFDHAEDHGSCNMALIMARYSRNI